MFEHDLFISYAHDDNERLYDPVHGWIDLLHKRLEIRLTQLLGEKPKIWRDPKLSGNDVFGETLIIELSKAALLVSVLSPRYIKSGWCLKELDEFHNRSAQGGGVSIGGKSRVFKVIKTMIELEEHPEELRGVLGYEFYSLDPATNRFREFGQDDGARRDHRYWDKLEDLAQDIKDLIEKIRARQGVAPTTTMQPSGKTIYLAETTSDLSELNPPKTAPERKPATNGNGAHDPKLVYLICDQPDYDTVAPIEEYLFQCGFEVSSMAGDADPQAHRENLLLCDAALAYCGATHDRWLELKKMDLFKLRGERKKPMLAKAFYISAPQTAGKERFRIQDALVIRNYGDFYPASLNPFIEQIERAKGTQL